MRPVTQKMTRHLAYPRLNRIHRPASPAAPISLVDVWPTLTLAKVLRRDSAGWRVQVGERQWTVSCDPVVDPALVEEAIAAGGRVVIEGEKSPAIVGVLSTRRAVTLDRDGNIDARVKRFSIAAEEVLVKAAGTFLQLKGEEIELYGNRILARARELTRLLGRMIKLN